MMRLRPANERGHADHGWLKTNFSFSFADYHDPAHMGFRDLRVLNDDIIMQGQGFGTHGHRDMEIITYVIKGALEHRDSMGTGSVLRRGDVQRMTAGSGVTHSEFNHSPDDPLRLLQIWVLPEAKGITPGYEEKKFSDDDKRGRLRLLVSPESTDGSLRIHQDVKVYASILDPDDEVRHEIASERHAWIQVAQGKITVNGTELIEGDGAAVSEETELNFQGVEQAEFLLFDLN